MSLQNSQNYQDQLENFRKEINQIDEKIINLLQDRMRIVSAVGELKKNFGESFFIKSAREADMLRNLVKNSDERLAKSTIASIWRKIITNANMLEQPLSIALHNPKNLPDFKYILKDYYNNDVPITSFDSAWNVVAEVEKGNCQIAVFELPDAYNPNEKAEVSENWWISLANNQIGLKIFAKIPFLTNARPSGFNSEFSLVAAAIKPAEKSQRDNSLMVIELSVEFSNQDLLSGLKSCRLSGKIIKKTSLKQFEGVNFFLVEIDDFVDEQDSRISQLTASKIKPFIRIIGNFAK